ncbi:MAG TPA: biotin/lipoyl-containing protein, partial [Arenibaculum sp.]|nr:biotin/lipoyl-containing protein [Arenibaculum sp.]
HARAVEQERTISGQMPVQPAARRHEWVARVDRANRAGTVVPAGSGWTATVAGAEFLVMSDWTPWRTGWLGTVGGRTIAVQVERTGTGYRLIHAGAELTVEVLTPRAAELAELMPVKVPPDMSKFLLSPMPGLLTAVAVGEGQEVKAGQELAVVEAMKMENILRADADGTVVRVHAQAGASLAVDQIILEFA